MTALWHLPFQLSRRWSGDRILKVQGGIWLRVLAEVCH